MPVDVSGGDGWTALHRATMFNRTDIIKHLLHEEANVNRQTEYDKYTPLHLAARNNNTEAARILMDNGVDVNLVNSCNKTPLHYAGKGSEVERLLMQVQQSAP